MDHCCLCGITLAGLKRRYQTSPENAAFVSSRCKSSPFLYPLLASTERAAERQGVCIPCVNWKRRVDTCGLRRNRQPMLQMDQLILFLLQPGFHQEPDHRCMERLIAAARQADNPYRVVFPVQALTILDNARGNTLHDCIVSWWDYNGRTEFFASGCEARMVRCALKKEWLPAPDGL